MHLAIKLRLCIKGAIKEMKMSFYFGLALQLIGFASVGLCLFAGLTKGDYGHLELVQFLGGSAIFYIGSAIKGRTAS